MIDRHLKYIGFDDLFGRQMRFIAGPRQCGKTTLAKQYLDKSHFNNLYFNWDTRETKNAYLNDPYFFESKLHNTNTKSGKPWICFNEIHKMPKWKNILKDYFDKYEDICQFIITGSARLDFFKKSGDSLAGRYFLFRLFPLILSEAISTDFLQIGENETAGDLIERKLTYTKYEQTGLEQLLNYSGFPEPFLKSNNRFINRWRNDLLDRIIREDIRDLTRIVEIENIAVLIQLLPERVGSPLSINTLQQVMNISYTSVKNLLHALEMVYAVFFVSPYHHKISRALSKYKKCYFYDWTRVSNLPQLFENYVAIELKALTSLWSDSGVASFELHYIRTKDGKETDFLITKNETPWCLFEVKLKSDVIAGHHYKHAEVLGNIPFVQLTLEDKILKKHTKSFYTISASRFFAH